jgi:hypothetical protein
MKGEERVMELPGLERLVKVCHRLDLGLRTKPPERNPPKAGTLMAGIPFDPVLAAVYARVGQASFATQMDGLVLLGNNDGEFGLEASNKAWREYWQENFALPLFRFAGEPGLAYHYMTVPALADEHGLQPVVRADSYEVPYALPVASNVDQLFMAYADYLEALVARPDYEPGSTSGFLFPWDVPHIMAADVWLVELIRAEAFAPFMTNDDARIWASRIMARSTAR